MSEYFGLGHSQPFLDFVDVDIDGDLPVFLDPTALLAFNTTWANECVALVQDFFQYILSLLGANQRALAEALVAVLREPNETHLGFSKGRARGRGLGPTSAEWLCAALSESKAIDTGLLEHLEDTILMIPGVAGDLVSDIATNLMREPLLAYTEEQCVGLGIPVQSNVASGPLWDPSTHRWQTHLVSQPLVPSGPLLLVPKVLARRKLEYDYDEYYRDYILPYLMEAEIEQKTALVRTVKSLPRVYRKDLEAKYGHGKQAVVSITQARPQLLAAYRRDKREQRRIRRPALTHDELADTIGGERPDIRGLLAEVVRLVPGPDDAASYHEAVYRLLTVLFHPALSHGRKEQKIHGGLKRIDITFDNVATSGFFQWLWQNYSAPLVFAECKNYGKELGNPELDQMIGRFSPSRGQFGLIVCRSLEDPDRFYRRCQHAADDQHGYIVALTDEDLDSLVSNAASGTRPDQAFGVLRSRFQKLLLRADLPVGAEEAEAVDGLGGSSPAREGV